MNSEHSIALVPLGESVKPVMRIGQKGLSTFDRHDRQHDGIIFAGYRPNRVNTIYGPPGKKVEATPVIGGIVDIYV